MEEKRLVKAIPWTEEEDAMIKAIAAEYPKATRYYLKESFKLHFPNTEHTDGAIEGRFSMVAPKNTSKKWPPERCERLVTMKKARMTDKQIAAAFVKDGIKITSVGIASQCAALRTRGMLNGTRLQKAYTRGITGVRQTKLDVENTMQYPPTKEALKTSAPAVIVDATWNDAEKLNKVPNPLLEANTGNALQGRVFKAAHRMSKLTGEQMHLAHRLFDSLDKILG